MFPRLLLLIAAIFCSCASYAQQSELQLKNISRKDGLPSNEAYCIYRDSKDYLWIGTDQGVVRYNGTKMEHFTLPDNVVFKIREDEKGRIWFFSHSGLLSYYYKNTVTPYKYNAAITQQLKGILITDARVEDDIVYINSHQRYNYEISKAGKITFHYYADYNEPDLIVNISKFGAGYFAQKKSDNTGVAKSLVLKVKKEGREQDYTVPFNQQSLGQYSVIEHEGTFYFFNSKTVVKLNADGTSIYKKMPSEIISIGFGNSGNIWLGLLQAGAVSLNEQLEENTEDHILSRLSVSSIIGDNEGGTWFATLEKGVFYLQKNVLRLLHAEGLNDRPIFRMRNVDDSMLLLASSSGLHQLSNGAPKLILPVYLLNAAGIFTKGKSIYLCASSNNKAQPQTSGKNILLKGLAFTNVFLLESSCDLIQPDSSTIAFGSGSSFIRVHPLSFINKPYLIGDSIFSFPRGFLFKDAGDKIWLGNINSLYCLSTPFGSPRKAETGSSLTDKGITAMRQMDNGLYVLGIRFGGIALMKGNTIIANITEAQGLSSNYIKYILVRGNELWLATAKGISVIKFSSFEPLKYDITNIASDKNIYDIVFYQIINYRDKIVAATSNGVYTFDPANLSRRASERIPFYISSVHTYKGDTSDIDALSVPFSHNRITVSFSAIAYNSSEDIEYYYRFANVDTAWQRTKATDLLLENLPAGKYSLELKCMLPGLHGGSDIKKLSINILKPWWQSGIFIIACILFALSLLYIVYYFKIRKVKNSAREKFAVKSKMIELEYAALQAQMDPHFIFNCLTSIQQLVILGEGAKANQYLVKFSRLIRLGLELSESNYTPIANEKKYIEEYLSLEQLRFPDIFDFSVHVESSITSDVSIPHMMVQPFVENSVRHGIRDLKDRRGSISVIFSMQGKRIACTVMDNGMGINAALQGKNTSSARKSFGIDLVKKRLDIYNTPKEKLFFVQIEDLHQAARNTAGGTLVTIYMPYKIIQNG